MNWKLAYAVGFHPWESGATNPDFVRALSSLLEREEAGRGPPYEKALDLGTGSGIWAVELARRGWRVTGIDLAERALERARGRVAEAGVDVRLLHGDVTALRAAGVGSGFRLVLDTGTFHDLDDAQRAAVGREIDAVATPDATVLLLVWTKRRRPLIRGATRGEIEAAFPDWTVSAPQTSHFRLPWLADRILRPGEQWYRLRRAG